MQLSRRLETSRNMCFRLTWCRKAINSRTVSVFGKGTHQLSCSMISSSMEPSPPWTCAVAMACSHSKCSSECFDFFQAYRCLNGAQVSRAYAPANRTPANRTNGRSSSSSSNLRMISHEPLNRRPARMPCAEECLAP